MVPNPGGAGINTAQMPFVVAPAPSPASIPAVYGPRVDRTQYGASAASGRATVPYTRFW